MKAADLIGIGSRVLIRDSEGDELHGYMTERYTYNDGSVGAFVQLDHGPVVVLPFAELQPGTKPVP